MIFFLLNLYTENPRRQLQQLQEQATGTGHGSGLVSTPPQQVIPSEAEHTWVLRKPVQTRPYIDFATASPGHILHTSAAKPPALVRDIGVGRDLARPPWPTPRFPSPIPSAGTCASRRCPGRTARGCPANTQGQGQTDRRGCMDTPRRLLQKQGKPSSPDPCDAPGSATARTNLRFSGNLQ